MRKNNRKGFTIVELVIVIAVIAILATVLVPTFGNVIEKANKSAALQEARNEFTEYMIDYAATGKDDVIIKVTVKTTDYYFAVVNGQIAETPYDSYADAKAAFGENVTVTPETEPTEGNVFVVTVSSAT